MQRWLGPLLLWCLLGWVSLARAQAFELSWQAPAACPTAATMRARITQLIAGAQVADQALKADARIERHDARWRLQLELDVRGRHATRTLQDDDCTSLSEAAAWLVSVAIDPHLAPPANVDTTASDDEKAAALPVSAAAQTPAATTSSTAPNRSEQETTADQDSAPHATGAWPLHLRANLFGGVFAGGLAGAAVSTGGEAGVEIGPISLAMLGAYQFERSHALSAPGTRAAFSSLEFGFEGCFQWGDALRIGPCALVSVLRTAGSTHGVTSGEDDAFVWATAGAGINARYVVFSPLELSLDGGLWAPISARPRFEVASLGNAGEAAPLGGRIRLGVGIRWP